MSKPTEYVLGFGFDDAMERVLLIEKKKPDWQAGYLNGIGGKIEEADMSLFHAMTREFYEECGLEVSFHDWSYLCAMNFRDVFSEQIDATVHILHVNLSGMFDRYRQCEDEIPTPVLVEDIASYKVVNNLRWIVPMITDKEYVKHEACKIMELTTTIP